MKLLLSWLFLAGVLATTGIIHSWHYFDLGPDAGESLKFSDKIISSDEAGIVHLLKSDCGCSKIVAKKLLNRVPHPSVKETVVFIGPMKDLDQQFQKKGFRTLVWDEREFLKKNSVDGAPMLIIHDDRQEILYSGGYVEGMVTPDKNLKDREIISKTLAGLPEHHLPTLGCAVSNKMKNLLDPLGIKYARSADLGDKNDKR